MKPRKIICIKLDDSVFDFESDLSEDLSESSESDDVDERDDIVSDTHFLSDDIGNANF